MPNEDLYYDDGSWKYEHEDRDDDFDDRAMYMMSDLEFEMTQRRSDYDNLEDMLADGIDIDDIPESYYNNRKREKTEDLNLAKFYCTIPRNEEDMIPF